ncbi:hypothetical protein Tco_0246604 [Tanacetum coccineum]
MDLAQKAKIKWSIEGDEKSNFFHGILNEKRNQMNIRGITIDDVWKEQPNDVKQEFLSHFQDRFAKPSERRANIDMRFPKTIFEDQSQDLEREVSKQEIKTAVWGCGTDKSPGPDGFSFGFYRHFWPVIEHDVYMAVNHFFIHGEIPPGCNSSFIALIPKVPDANLVKDFRPISLIGSIYKIIAKILSNRLVNVLGDIVNEVQSAFIAERQMLNKAILYPLLLYPRRDEKAFMLSFQRIFKRWDFKGYCVRSICLPFAYVLCAEDALCLKGVVVTVISSTSDSLLKCFFHASGIAIRVNLEQNKYNGINVGKVALGHPKRLAKLGCLFLKVSFTTILGLRGGRTSTGKSCWLSILSEVRSLQRKGGHIKEIFPDLYVFEEILKGCYCSFQDRSTRVWSAPSVRISLRGGIEQNHSTVLVVDWVRSVIYQYRSSAKMELESGENSEYIFWWPLSVRTYMRYAFRIIEEETRMGKVCPLNKIHVLSLEIKTDALTYNRFPTTLTR